MQLLVWLVSLIVGAVGGNVAGALFKKVSLGTMGNSIAGIVGGAIGGPSLSAALGPTGVAGWLGSVLGALIGGMVLMIVVGLVKPEK